MQSLDSIEMCVYGMRKGLTSKKEKTKCNNIVNNAKNY